MRVESVRGSSLGDNLGTNPQLHRGPIVVGSNAMAGPSDTGICLEGNTTTGQVWKLPSVNGNPTVGSTVNGMVYFDANLNAPRLATELGFAWMGQAVGSATSVTVSNTTAETTLHQASSGALTGQQRLYRWTERMSLTNTSGGSVVYTFRFRYDGLSIVTFAANITSGSTYNILFMAWVTVSGSNPTSMPTDIFTQFFNASTGVTTMSFTSAAGLVLNSSFLIRSTVAMSVASPSASATSQSFLLEAFGG